MIRTDAFVSDMCKIFRAELPSLTFAPETRRKDNYECVDIVGKRGSKERVLIEIELRRYGPERNIIKIWKRLLRGQYPPNIIVIQAFSKFYDGKPKAREYAEFIAEKMTKEYKRVRYIPIRFEYRPAARKIGTPVMKGAGRRQHHAKELANEVVSRLSKLI